MDLPSVKDFDPKPFDVVVAGGGVAGIGAAIAAARHGCPDITRREGRIFWGGGVGVTEATVLSSCLKTTQKHTFVIARSRSPEWNEGEAWQSHYCFHRLLRSPRRPKQ